MTSITCAKVHDVDLYSLVHPCCPSSSVCLWHLCDLVKVFWACRDVMMYVLYLYEVFIFILWVLFIVWLVIILMLLLCIFFTFFIATHFIFHSKFYCCVGCYYYKCCNLPLKQVSNQLSAERVRTNSWICHEWELSEWHQRV